ncbi:hypothetical protein D3C75_1095330 [compost metagenome]
MAKATNRCCRDHAFENVRAYCRGHGGLDVAWGYGIDGHALAGDFPGQCHGETMDASLGGGVVGLAELATLTVDRGDIDDPPPAFGQHAFNDLLGGVEQARQVGPDHAVPVFRGELAKRRVAGDASVVDQHIDRAELFTSHLESLAG